MLQHIMKTRNRWNLPMLIWHQMDWDWIETVILCVFYRTLLGLFFWCRWYKPPNLRVPVADAPSAL